MIFRRKLSYLAGLLNFTFRHNSLAIPSIAIAVGSAMFELAAMSVLLPLSMWSSGQELSLNRGVSGLWFKLLPLKEPGALGIIFCVLFMLRMVTSLASQGLFSLIGKRLIAQLSSTCFATIINDRPIGEIESQGANHYVTLAGDECVRASILVTSIFQLSASIFLGALYFGALFFSESRIALGVIGFIFLCLLLMLQVFRISFKLGQLQTVQSRDSGSIFLDSINGVKSIRALSAENFVIQEYRAKITKYTRTLFKVELLNLFARIGPVLILLCIVIVGLAVSVDSKPDTSIFPTILTLTAFLMRFFPTVGQSLNIFLRILSEAKACQDVTALLNLNSSSTDKTSKLPLEKISKIELENATFAFPGKDPVFRSLHFHFQSGKTYAIRGPSGIGKSTLLDAVLGFRQLNSGTVKINDQNLNFFDIHEIRKKAVLVTQNTTIFKNSLRVNLSFGQHFRDAQMSNVCNLLNLSDLIGTDGLGLDSEIHYQGTNLSGGQRQRIGIARALLRDADVLILDEATSALDRDTRDKVLRLLFSEFKDKILIFVTHDNQVMGRVDRVYTLTGEDGNGGFRQSKNDCGEYQIEEAFPELSRSEGPLLGV